MPQDLPEYMKLMSDIAVLAFLTDSTRVCTLKLNQFMFGRAIGRGVNASRTCRRQDG